MKPRKAEIARDTASYDFRLLRAINPAFQAIILVASHDIGTSASHGRGRYGALRWHQSHTVPKRQRGGSTVQQPCQSSGAFNRPRDQHGNTGFVDHCQINIGLRKRTHGIVQYEACGKTIPRPRGALVTWEKLKTLSWPATKTVQYSTVVHGSVPGDNQPAKKSFHMLCHQGDAL
jgi:hypothetical protein